MKHLRTVILIGALAGVGWWLWTVFFPSPERVIRGRLADLANTISFAERENVVARANKIGKLPIFFTPEVEIEASFPAPDGRSFESHRIAGRDEISLAAQAAHAMGGSLEVEFVGLVVTVAPDKESATVHLTVRTKAPRDPNFFVQEMKFMMIKVKKDWLIRRVETVRTLS
jgi:hypothetical protein